MEPHWFYGKSISSNRSLKPIISASTLKFTKREQIKHKVSRKKEIIKVEEKINEIESRKIIEKNQ